MNTIHITSLLSTERCCHVGRRPRRLGGGKGGDSRETKLPKDPARRGLITASAGTPGPPALAALPPPPISADRERDRDRY